MTRRAPAAPPHPIFAQTYAMALETGARDPVPSYVLIHYVKDDAPIAQEVLPPIVRKNLAPVSSAMVMKLDEDSEETDRVQGNLFRDFGVIKRPAASNKTLQTPTTEDLEDEESANGSCRCKQPTGINYEPFLNLTPRHLPHTAKRQDG